MRSASRAFFAGIAERALIFDLEQVRRYLKEPDIRDKARASIERAIGPDTTVMIAHSLGSVIAYEALVELGLGGSYFTGREQALRELAAWLSAEHSDGRARVITGGPGCGKSAVISRIVTLAHPAYRAEVLAPTRSATLDPSMLPPEGVVNVAVHARHKLLVHVTAQIATGLGLTVRDPAELSKTLKERGDKSVIVVDALDEADEHEKIAAQLLRPLAELTNVFLLVGTRPDSSGHERRFRSLGESTVELDLDKPRYVGADDVARYVERRLLAAEEPGRPTPYRDSPEVARIVADAVAER
jgi:hypothetical protein